MLYKFLITILVLDSFFLIGAILLQSGKGSGLAANFGGASSSPDAFIGIRQAGTILTKATWWCAGIFLGLALVLQIMSTRTTAPRSVLEKTFGNQPAPAAPAAPGAGGTAPVVPLEPATGGTPLPAAGGTTAPAPGGAKAPGTRGKTAPAGTTSGTPSKGATVPPPSSPTKR
jgi:preprotein translocase subunit SecG